MKYNIRQRYMYTADFDDITIELGNLKFCQSQEWKRDDIHTRSLWAVIENASSEENQKLIDGFENVCNLLTYELPFDIVIVSIYNVEFLDGNMPELISVYEMNEKLRNVHDNAVWVELMIPDMKIMSVYRMKYVYAPDNVVLSEIPICSLSGDELRYKSLNYLRNCKLNIFEKYVNDMSDHHLTKVLTDDDANELWSSLVDKVITDSGYNPDKVNKAYNYNKFAEAYKDVIDYLNNPENYISKKDIDEQES